MDSLFVDKLSKCFDRGPAEPQSFRPGQLVRDLRRWASRSNADAPAQNTREFWALRDVSFRVKPGTVLGIIGPNGAGKSTLLKILARVVVPTSGRAVGVGRLISLLELGVGFDPELTARDNIIMNAAMNGVPRAEVLRRFDAIMEFAETGEFLHTQLKHYSSGMYLRLAFSCAINMDPQILLADEILAVGDIAFQERCLRRVQEEAQRGLTVLFVSHDMDAIARVCSRVIWLNKGQVVSDGDPEEVIDEYQNATWEKAEAATGEKGRHANRYGRIIAVNLISEDGKEIGGAPVGEKVGVRITFETYTQLVVSGSMDLYSRNVWLLRAKDERERRVREAGIFHAIVWIPANFLTQTNYSVNVSLTVRRKNEVRDHTLVMYKALTFMAFAGEAATVAKSPKMALLAPSLSWQIDPVAQREPHAVRS
jgi:lipopolysaccharide transport system ATP-binding protein